MRHTISFRPFTPFHALVSFLFFFLFLLFPLDLLFFLVSFSFNYEYDDNHFALVGLSYRHSLRPNLVLLKKKK